MSSGVDRTMTISPLPLEVAGPVCGVPSLEEIERLTAVPERRCVSGRGLELLREIGGLNPVDDERPC